MAFWGAPQIVDDHASRACAAALQCQAELRELNGALKARGLPELATRIGINTGDAIVGNIGTDTRMSYTAIGGMVNLASRVEGLNKEYHTAVLICETTMKALGEGFGTRVVDRVVVKGKTVPVGRYELLPKSAVVDIRAWERLRTHNEAMQLYFAGNLERAAEMLASVLRDDPNDFVAAMHHGRIVELLREPQADRRFNARVMASK